MTEPKWHMLYALRIPNEDDEDQQYMVELGSDYVLTLSVQDEDEVLVGIEKPTSPVGPSTLVVTVPPDMLVRVEHIDPKHGA